MRPKLELLDQTMIERILGEAFHLLENPGVRVAPLVFELLSSAGARIEEEVAHVPEALARKALASVAREFFLHDRNGRAAVHYGADDVQFAPGSSCLNILDSESQQPRPAQSADLIQLVQVAEMLPQYAAQSTALVCNDVPQEMTDWYRLLLVLWYSEKPVVTGAFAATSLATMLELLAQESGGRSALRQQPRAIFDVCPSSPLNWSDFAAYNIVELARAGVPAEIVSVPLAGATAPVTLAGSVVQHAAECLGGIVIHQLAQPGAPVVWGGAPAVFDMRAGTAPMGAIETAMLNMACSQVGKYLGLPTHGYLVASDAKAVDAQAGMESSRSAVLGALAGVNMISGAGMLDMLACHSLEKLVIDAEAIGSAQRLLQGIELRNASLAVAAFAEIGLQADFLKLKETRALFRSEQYLPSPVIDRGGAIAGGAVATPILARARTQARELLASYARPGIAADREQALLEFAEWEAGKSGVKQLPGVESAQLRRNWPASVAL